MFNDRSDIVHGILWIVVAAGGICAMCATKQLGSVRGAIILIACGVLLIPIFSVDPIDLDCRLTVYAAKQDKPRLAPIPRAIVEKENDKAIAEIKLRSEEEDTWFKAKFVLVGTLLASAVTFLGLGAKEGGSARANELIESWVKSPPLFAVLGFACIVTIGIDIHLRSNMSVVQQLGLWLTYYAEPALLQSSFKPYTPYGQSKTSQVSSNDDQNDLEQGRSGFLGWEQFLRVQLGDSQDRAKMASNTGKTLSRRSGMQTDPLWGIVVWSHCHFLTVVLYVLLLVLFQNLAANAVEIGRQLRHMVVFGFIMVHLALALLAVSSHLIPPIFIALPLFPYLNQPFVHAAIVLVLVLLNIPFILRLTKRRPSPVTLSDVQTALTGQPILHAGVNIEPLATRGQLVQESASQEGEH